MQDRVELEPCVAVLMHGHTNNCMLCVLLTEELECKPDEFTCHNIANKSNCIPLNWVCDGTYDCDDRTDEVSCSKNHSLVVEVAVMYSVGRVVGSLIPPSYSKGQAVLAKLMILCVF